MIFERQYRNHLVMSLAIPLFQQCTGINVIIFYAPLFSKAIGFTTNGSLLSATAIGVANVFGTLIALVCVDKFGRKPLLLAGGVIMFFCQVMIGLTFQFTFKENGFMDVSNLLPQSLLALVCVYVLAFACSWGPMGCLLPGEIFPLEIRSTGMSISVMANMFATFIISQFSMNMFCELRFHIFYTFAIIVLVMTVFVVLFLPETKGIYIGDMPKVWEQQRFLRRWKFDDIRAKRIKWFGPWI